MANPVSLFYSREAAAEPIPPQPPKISPDISQPIIQRSFVSYDSTFVDPKDPKKDEILGKFYTYTEVSPTGISSSPHPDTQFVGRVDFCKLFPIENMNGPVDRETVLKMIYSDKKRFHLTEEEIDNGLLARTLGQYLVLKSPDMKSSLNNTEQSSFTCDATTGTVLLTTNVIKKLPSDILKSSSKDVHFEKVYVPVSVKNGAETPTEDSIEESFRWNRVPSTDRTKVWRIWEAILDEKSIIRAHRPLRTAGTSRNPNSADNV